ncbi:hypothetical protein D3C78_1019410 [compost metagenome]
MNTRVAGFSTGLPIQNASAAPTETFCRRMPAATGAAQQLHIMPGNANSPPRRVEAKPALPNRRSNQSLGISTCSNEPRMTARTAAFQIARKYTLA